MYLAEFQFNQQPLFMDLELLKNVVAFKNDEGENCLEVTVAADSSLISTIFSRPKERKLALDLLRQFALVTRQNYGAYYESVRTVSPSTNLRTE